MRIGIVGAGTVGSNLARALLGAGHEVMLSSREPESDRMQALIGELGSHASVGTVAQTVAFSNLVILALRWDAVPDAVIAGGDWTGKILIDVTNRLGVPESAAQELAQIAHGARVVKAFNTVGAEHFQNPMFNGERASLLIAGDDEEAKAIVSKLIADLGFEPIDAGNLAVAAHLEDLAELWLHLARGLGRNFAFRIIRR
ncbi:MAG: NAD(P)-binding domain-containing protein [Anaerolineae bacterium]|nr:NAD(P)-binding domain-containing protein [Anaerolineae bacterium]